MWINQLSYCYMLGKPYYKFIYILIFKLNKINKKILEFILYRIKKVNQQETLDFNESSETLRNITYSFENINLPSHKKKYDLKFLQWFIGFTEGDGSFIVSKNKVYFDISQNIEDIQILYYIKKELGFGKVLLRKELDRRVGVFYVTGKENFLRLIHIFNGNLCTEYKNNQFKAWIDCFNLQYKEQIIWKKNLIILTLDNAWLSGFTDAEGSFYGRVKVSKSNILGKQPMLTFSITQKSLQIINIIKELFLGKNTKFSNVRYDPSWEGWEFHCSSISNLNIIKTYFFKFPLKTKKYRSFTKWTKIHQMLLDKKYLTKEGLNIIEQEIKLINKNNKLKMKSDPPS